jgi:hypothetical protein
MNIKTVLMSAVLAFSVLKPVIVLAQEKQNLAMNPLAIPLQAHTAKDMWESFFNQCWSYSFVDKEVLDSSLQAWQKRNANRWQVYWLLLENAAEENSAFKTKYNKFKKQSLARAQQQTINEHAKFDNTGKKQLCDKLVLMLNDPRSDLPEDKSKKSQAKSQEGVAIIGK